MSKTIELAGFKFAKADGNMAVFFDDGSGINTRILFELDRANHNESTFRMGVMSSLEEIISKVVITQALRCSAKKMYFSLGTSYGGNSLLNRVYLVAEVVKTKTSYEGTQNTIVFSMGHYQYSCAPVGETPLCIVTMNFRMETIRSVFDFLNAIEYKHQSYVGTMNKFDKNNRNIQQYANFSCMATL